MLVRLHEYCNAIEISKHSKKIKHLPFSWVVGGNSVNEQVKTAASGEHPLAGTRMTGADIVVQVLADEGVDTIFGYSGGAILPTYDAVFRYNDTHRTSDGKSPMPLIVPANEQGAGFMASGYARASGKVGVVMVTSGPGATNRRPRSAPTRSRRPRCPRSWARSPSTCSS